MFDRYAAQTAPSWGRRALFLASILLHVSAGIALAIYSIFHIEEIAPPAISLTFFAAPPPPPPPPPKAHHHTEHHEIKKPEIIKQPDPHAIVQPKKEEEKKEEDKPDEEGATEDGVEGGVAGGVKGGVVGGTVGGTGKGPVSSPKTVPMFTLMSQKIAAVNPHLSDGFKAQHPHQNVVGTYKVCIGNDGHVNDVTTMNSVAGEDGPIITQMKSTWLYKPQPVPVCFVSRLVFQIP
jgi:protein TonB